MILLDSSEFMRNGDYIPTRLEAQVDAANMLVGAKTQSHPESTVGVSAGTELLVSPTDDVGKIMSSFHELPIKSSQADITASVQVASLALKHRPNKNGSQRIVLFVGSPLTSIETRALQKAGRQLKKNNVAIDVVAMGELETNESKLRELVDAANGRQPAVVSEGESAPERTCHLVTIPAGVLPSDVLASSPILAGSGGSAFAAAAAGAATGAGGGGGGGGGGNDFAEYGGVDPNMDPELAMALRVSMEDERARQERAAAAAAASSSAAEETTSDGNAAAAASGGGENKDDAEMGDAAAPPAAAAASAAAAAAMDMGLSEEEALLQQALAMSMNENENNSDSADDDVKPAAASSGDGMEVDEDDDEEAAMQAALQMSMQASSAEGGGNGDDNKEEAKTEEFQDPAFVNELLGSMPGVDPNDPEIQEALRKAHKKKDEDDKK